MCIMGPDYIKDDIYNVMTNSRELTNYCQESVKSLQSKKISDSLNNFHLESAEKFIKKTLIDDFNVFFEIDDMNFSFHEKSPDKQIYSKAIDYMQNYFV